MLNAEENLTVFISRPISFNYEEDDEYGEPYVQKALDQNPLIKEKLNTLVEDGWEINEILIE